MKLLSATWTGNNSYTTDIGTSFQVNRVTLQYDASITNDAYITVDRTSGANYDEDIVTFDNSAGATSNSHTFSDKELRLGTGDELKVACDVGGDNAYLTIDFQRLY